MKIVASPKQPLNFSSFGLDVSTREPNIKLSSKAGKNLTLPAKKIC